jgi:hypothetical protein
MEFIADHPLCILQALTALVAFAAGFSTYHLGLRRSRRRDHSGTGGQHGLLNQPSARRAPPSDRRRQAPAAPRGLLGDAAGVRRSGAALPDCALVA